MAKARETAQRVAAMPETNKALTLRIEAFIAGFTDTETTRLGQQFRLPSGRSD